MGLLADVGLRWCVSVPLSCCCGVVFEGLLPLGDPHNLDSRQWGVACVFRVLCALYQLTQS